MRKLISLGLLALSLGFLSNPLFAGDASDCESFKNDSNRALYGLCIAYWNTTNAVAREKILTNFVNKGGDAKDLSGDDFVPCTCWTRGHVDDVLNDQSTVLEKDGWTCDDKSANFEGVSFDGYDIVFLADPTEVGCEFFHPDDSVVSRPYDSRDAELTCRDQIHELILEFTGHECMPDTP